MNCSACRQPNPEDVRLCIWLSDRASPCNVTSVDGFDTGKQPLAARREDAIREHEKVVPELLPAGEAQINSISVLAKLDERRTLKIAIAAELAKKGPV